MNRRSIREYRIRWERIQSQCWFERVYEFLGHKQIERLRNMGLD